MNVANIYRKLKQILDYSNTSLNDWGLKKVDTLNKISIEIEKLGEINRLPYFLQGSVVSLTENDLIGVTRLTSKLSKYNPVSITAPDSILYIDYEAFKYCTNLKNIYFKSITPPTLYGEYTIPSTATIHVPIGSGDAYKSATNWSKLAHRIVEDVEVN